MDDQLVTGGAVVAPDGLATLEHWQAGRHVQQSEFSCIFCMQSKTATSHRFTVLTKTNFSPLICVDIGLLLESTIYLCSVHICTLLRWSKRATVR